MQREAQSHRFVNQEPEIFGHMFGREGVGIMERHDNRNGLIDDRQLPLRNRDRSFAS